MAPPDFHGCSDGLAGRQSQSQRETERATERETEEGGGEAESQGGMEGGREGGLQWEREGVKKGDRLQGSIPCHLQRRSGEKGRSVGGRRYM